MRDMNRTRQSVRTVAFGLVLMGGALVLAQGVPAALDGYMTWLRLNADTVTENPSGAHPQPKNVYVNLEPSELLAPDGSFVAPFPDGTIVVKERLDPEALWVDRIYVMEKVEGAWSYGFYDRTADGTFAGQDLGTDNFCSGCHQGASGTDFVFTTYDRR